MPLSLEVQDLATVPEPLREHYTREGDEGPYKLAVEGMPDVRGLKSALERERETARAAKAKVREIEQQWEGLTRAEIDDLLARRAELEKADPSKVEEQIKQRVKQNDDAWSAKFTEVATSRETLLGELSKLKVRDALAGVGGKLGIGEGAQMEDFLSRGERLFKMSPDGSVKPLDNKGELVYGKDGIAPLSMEEFVKGLAETAPHLFRASSGGGASNGGGGGGAIVRAKADLKTPKEKSDYISQHGMEKYLQLPASRG